MAETCGVTLLSDSPPCPRPAGHWPAVPHRAHCPYGSGRWIDYIPAPAEKPHLLPFLEVDRHGFLDARGTEDEDGHQDARLTNGPVHWVLVTGSRYWGVAIDEDGPATPAEHAAAAAAANTLRQVLHVERGLAEGAGGRLGVFHGANPSGADKLADMWADGERVLRHRRPANWRPYGIYNPHAGKLRNTEMVNALKPWAAAGHPVICLAFSRDGSVGTAHCAAAADNAGIPTFHFDHDEPFPLPADHAWAQRVQELMHGATTT